MSGVIKRTDKAEGEVLDSGEVYIPSLHISEEDLMERTKNIFEQVIGVPIIITEDDKCNWISMDDNAKSHIINIQNPPEPEIPKQTALHHELGHYFFRSPVQKAFEILERMAVSDFTEKEQVFVKEIYKTTYNLIEDQRIESMLGDIYEGTNNRFLEMREALGYRIYKDMKDKVDDPIHALQASRFFNEHLVPDKYKEALSTMEDVKLTGRNGGIVMTTKYIENVLKPYLKSITIPNIKEHRGCSGCNGTGRGCSKSLSKLSNMGKRCERDNSNCDHRGFANVKQESDEEGDIDEGIGDDLESDVDSLKNQGQKELDKAREDLERVSRSWEKEKSLTYETTNIERPTGEYKVNVNVAQDMNRMFKRIQNKTKLTLGQDGEFVSIPHVIQRKAQGYGDVMMKTKRVSGLTVLVSIDASGSMDSPDMIGEARNMAATLYSAIKNIKGINMNVIVWAGDGGKDIGISEAGRIKECAGITCDGSYYQTPTPMALDYSTRRLMEMKGNKKVMFFITDGQPACGGYDTEYLTEMSRKAVLRAERMGIKMMGVFVGSDEDNMKRIFKSRYARAPTMKEANTLITKKFKDIVLKQVKRR